MFSFSRENTGLVAKWWRNIDKQILFLFVFLLLCFKHFSYNSLQNELYWGAFNTPIFATNGSFILYAPFCIVLSLLKIKSSLKKMLIKPEFNISVFWINSNLENCLHLREDTRRYLVIKIKHSQEEVKQKLETEGLGDKMVEAIHGEGASYLKYHFEYREVFKKLYKKKKFKIYDMRNLYSVELMKKKGFDYYSIGR